MQFFYIQLNCGKMIHIRTYGFLHAIFQFTFNLLYFALKYNILDSMHFVTLEKYNNSIETITHLLQLQNIKSII